MTFVRIQTETSKENKENKENKEKETNSEEKEFKERISQVTRKPFSLGRNVSERQHLWPVLYSVY